MPAFSDGLHLMQLSDFDFDLPEHLIAQQPPAERGASRLLSALPGEPLRDEMFSVLPQLVGRGDVLVFNNTKVMKARLFGQKASGGKIEALIERVLDAHTALAHIRSSKSPKPGTRLLFDGGIGAEMTAREGELFRLHFDGEETVYRLLEQHGRLPLPPYIERAATAMTRAVTKPYTPNTKAQWPRLPQACTSPIRCWRNSKPKVCAWRR